MSRIGLCTVALLGLTWLRFESPVVDGRRAEIGRMIDAWHQAAAKADADRYFSHLTSDAVFLGTDATERWTRDEFLVYAKPHFDKGTGWAFRAKQRHIQFAHDGTTAWFDELLDTEKMGTCRGSGVVVKTDAGWKIVHYNLSVPIPNGVFTEVKKVIDSAGQPPSDRP